MTRELSMPGPSLWRAAALIALAWRPSGAVALQSAEDMAQAGAYVDEALEARESGDLGTYLARLEDAEALRPGHPELLYLIAGGRAQTGDRPGAVGALDRIARMGLSLGSGSDPDFASLQDDAAYRDVLDRMRANREAVGVSGTVFVVPGEPDFIPEGIAFDPTDRSYYLGSVHKRKILRVDSAGAVTEFARPGTGGLMSAMGMFVDPGGRALWVATAGVPETGGLPEEARGRSAVFKFSLDTGDVLVTYHFSNREETRVVGDLTRAEDGDVYVSDSRGSGIYRIRAGGDFLETFVQPGVFRSPQGLTVSEDQRGLYVADYSKGIFLVHRLTREARKLEQPEDAMLLGIDGLIRDGHDLIAIQNGSNPHRILRLELSEDGDAVTRVRVLAANLPQWDEPTLGLLVGGRLVYVANSQWNRFVDGDLPALTELSDPRIMWLDPR